VSLQPAGEDLLLRMPQIHHQACLSRKVFSIQKASSTFNFDIHHQAEGFLNRKAMMAQIHRQRST
jgi:hypothetical protein